MVTYISGYDFDRYSTIGTRASNSYGYDQSYNSSSIAYRGFVYYQHGVEPKQLLRSYFPNYESSSQSFQLTHSSNEQFFQPYSHYANYCPDLYAHRMNNDDFEPPSSFNMVLITVFDDIFVKNMLCLI